MRSRVIARHIHGQSNRRIANEEGIDRETVNPILSQQEFVQAIARYQSKLLSMVPKAIGVYGEALNSDNLALATATATKLLEGPQVPNKNGIELTIQIANNASPEAESEQRWLLTYGPNDRHGSQERPALGNALAAGVGKRSKNTPESNSNAAKDA